jgi:hypothetical protein
MKLKLIGIFVLFVTLGLGGFAWAEAPVGFVDFIVYESDGRLHVAGWAADNKDGVPVKNVQVFLDGKLFGNAKLGLNRTDVAKNTNHPQWVKSGWVINEKIKIKKGDHKIEAYAFNKNNEKGLLINNKNIKLQVR